ncbi:hypothetical protein ACWD4J_35625 [Streptomyces sp. NPDC002577]
MAIDGLTEQATHRSLSRIEQLDDEIIALLLRRREVARELPAPSGPRATDPGFAEAVRAITGRYREHLGGGGELVARAVLVLCHPGQRP